MITDLLIKCFKRYHIDKHFSEFLPTRWQQKSTGIDMEKIRNRHPICCNHSSLIDAIADNITCIHKSLTKTKQGSTALQAPPPAAGTPFTMDSSSYM